MLALISKLSSFNQFPIIMQIFTTVITTFIFNEHGNLSQELSIQGNILTMHEQDRLYPYLYDLGRLVCSTKRH